MRRFPNSSQRPYSARRVVTLFRLVVGIGYLAGLGTLDAVSRSQTAERFDTALTLAERVAYQYAIEEVCWRHRIWPEENAVAKPSLDAVVSRREIEKKVEDYLRKSQQVADQRGQPITAGELQAEMDRIATHTRQPEVLRELFAAFGNDPFVIAECLAMPILAERLVADLTNDSNPVAAGVWPASKKLFAAGTAASTENRIPSATNLGVAAYRLPEIATPPDCDDIWTATSTMNAPEARQFHTAVWTGTEMIIWGGWNFSSNPVTLNTGARYYPSTDSWTPTSLTNVPSDRSNQSAAWNGSEMIVWGGFSHNMLLNTGGRYNPANDTWIPTSAVNAPAAREYHTAVWTGSQMIIWGGLGCNGNCRLNTGGRYNPGTDSWTPTSINNAPVARFRHSAVWDRGEMIVWSGSDQMNLLCTGGRYNPTNDSWTPTALANAPLGRVGHGAVWTGNEMFVWGGVDENFNDTNTGGRYSPVNDSWAATSLNNAPSPRSGHVSAWSGSEMIIWGGEDTTNFFNTGGRYRPDSDSWIPTTTVNAPGGRNIPTAIWTGIEMIVWGGVTDSGEMNTGGHYCAQPSTPIAQSVVSRKTHASAGSFDINLPLSGTPGVECRSGGATGDYTIVLTFMANVSVNGNPQAAVTSGIGSIGTGGVSDGGTVTIAGNVVTIPLTNVANAQTIQITLNGVNGSTNFAIPMSIVIGDTTANGVVNSSDVSQGKSQSGTPVTGTNFRADVTVDGSINASDIALIKSKSGTALPAANSPGRSKQ